MYFKLKVQKLGTLHFYLYCKINHVKAKLKYLPLLNIKNKQMGKIYKDF